MSKELISIIIPVYNAVEYLDRCLKSIRNQTYKIFECICVDDGSVDDSKIILSNFVELDSRFKYIYQENAGPSAARNNGIDTSKGEYITFVDADDYIDDDYLQNLLHAIIGSNADICCCGYNCILPNDQYKWNDFESSNNISRDLFLKQLLTGTGGITWGKLYKSELIKENCITFPNNISICEDQIFAVDCWKYAHNYSAINYYGYNYNCCNESSLTKKCDMNKWQLQFEVVEILMNKLTEDFSKTECEKILISKIKNIYFNIIRNSENVDTKTLKQWIRKEEHPYIRLIKINNIKDMVYYFPIKIRSYYGVKICKKILLSRSNMF